MRPVMRMSVDSFRDASASGGTIRSHAFEECHPAVPAVFFVAATVLSMSVVHPVFCVLSLVFSAAYGCIARGPRAMGKSLLLIAPLAVLVSLLNPFFSASGSTQVGSLFGYPLYAESLAYGACMGAMMAAVLLWLQDAAAVMTSEDALAVTGNTAPTLALMLSMIARSVPRYMRRGRTIAAIGTACTSASAGDAVDKVSDTARRFGILLSWSLEDSLQTADSMAARGWRSSRKRTFYVRRAFALSDAVLIGAVLTLMLASAAAALAEGSRFSFYPVMPALGFWWGYAPYVVFCAIPLLMEIRGAILWRR